MTSCILEDTGSMIFQVSKLLPVGCQLQCVNFLSCPVNLKAKFQIHFITAIWNQDQASIHSETKSAEAME